MDKAAILSGLFYFVSQVFRAIKGDCNIPAYLYTPSSKQYWQYNDPNGGSAMWMARYDTTGYNVALMSSKNQLQVLVLNYLCYDTYRPDPNGATTYMVRVSFKQFSCRVMTATESAILVREKEVASGTSATSCHQSNNMSPEGFWEVQYPERTAKNCPISDGDYEVNVQGGSYCSGNTRTAVRVEGESITVFCVQSNNIANEVGRMICYDSLLGSALDNDANGGILLIEDRTSVVDNSGRLDYRCVRFGTSGGRTYLKMRMSSTHALCESGVGYASANTQGYMTLSMTRSGTIFPNPDQTTPPFTVTVRPEPCSFPAGWRVPKLWWYLTGQTGQVVYVEEFGVKEMRRRSIVTESYSGGGTIATIGTYRCSDQKVEGSRRMYVRYQQDVSPSRRCAEYVRVPSTSPTSAPDALLARESLLGDNSLTAAECANEMVSVTDFNLLVPFPFDPSTKSCPFNVGYYSTTYGTNAFQEVCAGQASTTTITSNTLIMNTCSTTNTYEMPLNTRLSCVTSFAATDLYDANRDSGDFTILAYQDPLNGRYHYYCGRYQRQGNDIVISLNVHNKYETVCDTRANYNTAGQSNGKQYIRFTMKYIQDLTTTPGGVTQNTCSDCLNGAECITNSVGRVICVCQPGTTGSRCETGLPSGRCEDQWCIVANTRTCTNAQGGFYYCECHPGYDGPRCETDYNECVSGPCLNGGACQDGVNGYQCRCTDEFAGQSCEFRVAVASGSESNDLTVLIVLICILAAVVLAVVAVSVCMCHYRNDQREKSLIVDNDEISQAYGGSSMQAWYPDYKSNNSDSGSIGRHP